MLEVAEIFRLHAAAFCARIRDRLLPSQDRAMQDIQACRTAYFGGHVKQCDHCGEKVYTYHSCGSEKGWAAQGGTFEGLEEKLGGPLPACGFRPKGA